jgi:hypothetical protein
MITQPTTSQLIAAARNRLADAVIPNLTDDKVIVEVQMMMSLLDTLAVRAEHEIAWMHEESEAAAALGRQLRDAGRATPALGEALTALESADADSRHLSDVLARYELAGEVLSCASEIDGPTDGADALVRLRLDHEQAVVGVFAAVGRG